MPDGTPARGASTLGRLAIAAGTLASRLAKVGSTLGSGASTLARWASRPGTQGCRLGNVGSMLEKRGTCTAPRACSLEMEAASELCTGVSWVVTLMESA